MNWDQSDIALLESGEIKVLGQLTTASNASLYCEISDGEKTITAVYKPIAGERPLWDFPDGNLASREVATYLVSNALGLNVVPPTILREGPYGEGSVQLWIEDAEVITDEFTKEDGELRKIALLDAVVNNTDRKISHLLFKEGKIYGCDHGVTFHQDYKLRTVIWQFSGKELTDQELELLYRFDLDLREYLTNEEISALDSRIRDLIEEGVFPAPPTDWPAVPWPIY
jgi:hypothetical protein